MRGSSEVSGLGLRGLEGMDETFQIGVDESLQFFEFRTNIDFAGGNEEGVLIFERLRHL
jgi:hypothetical protein